VGYPPISDYALLSDCHSAALVSRQGSIDWCCFHRFDARPVFARLLDWDRGGYVRLAPVGHHTVSRRYLPGTNVVETRFEAEGGVVVLTDCLPVRSGEDDKSGQVLHPYHQLLRLVRGEAGEVEVALEFHPRFDYGLTVPRLELHGDRLGVVFGGADGLVLQSSFPLEQSELCGCDSRVSLRAGDQAFVAITYAAPHELRAPPLEAEEARRRVQATIEYWEEWSGRCRYDGPYRDAVVRSALVLKGLTNDPTGSIVAAPTTSLPETIGGVRNWDYRYAWLRDAALNLYALFRLGYTEEAHAFMAWLRRTTAGRADQLQPLYGVAGERLVPEVELVGLDGYRGSRPVWVGNAASGQLQLDVYGELLDTAWLYHRYGGDIDPLFWDFLCAVVDVVEARWQEPDEGIWELRDERRHFVSSKAMAWVAVDRAVKLAEARRLPADVARWRRLRHRIRDRIDQHGVDATTGAFVRSFGSGALDASALLLPLTRFVRPDDPRVRATVERIERELSSNGLVYRYTGDDGLPGEEGAFLICSFWLIDNLALLGETDRAQVLFERLLRCANDVGLLGEEIDPDTDECLGNFPQAFSHVGLIGAALNLLQAQRAERPE
jgi:GH15 family glucan-1,4-alpha-glucosidase